MITALIFASLLLPFLFLFIKHISTRRINPKLLPGSFGWPIIGESLGFLKARVDGVPERFVHDRLNKYRITSAFKTSILGEKVVFLCGPFANKFVFSNENEKVVAWWPASVSRLLGPSILTAKGEEGFSQRKILGDFFGPNSLMKFVRVMDEVARTHIAYHWKGKERVDTFVSVKSYAFELACRLYMSISDHQLLSRLSVNFDIFLEGVFSLPINLPGTRFHRAKKAVDALTKELTMLVNRRRMDLKRKGALPPQDLLTYLLIRANENGKFLPETVILKNLLSMLFAGHETTSSTLTLAIKYIGDLPRVYEKVLAEHREITAAKPPGELLDWDDMRKMIYTRNVVSEVLRLYPAANMVFREAIDNFEFSGYTIPKGWKIACSSSFTHKDPNLFPAPTTFDESRFDDSGPAPYTYLPFGGGPRMCLGKELASLEILVFLHNLVMNFKWGPVIPDERITFDPVPAPANGLPIHLTPHD